MTNKIVGAVIVYIGFCGVGIMLTVAAGRGVLLGVVLVSIILSLSGLVGFGLYLIDKEKP